MSTSIMLEKSREALAPGSARTHANMLNGAAQSSGGEWSARLSGEIARAVLGQRAIVERLQIALLTGGHVLLEGMPGLGKTLLVKSLAQAMGVSFERIQFTPDLLPSDVVGTMVYSPADGSFSAHLGPIFANLVLADEINRSPAKVQSALLEAMQERQVTLGGETHSLPHPFLVLATQNPVEQEGTYPLPEAQTDRFLFKLLLDYPSGEEELQMLRLWGQVTASPKLVAVSSGEELLAIRAEVDEVYVAPSIEAYILALVRRTRELTHAKPNEVRRLTFGASPRAALALYQASRAYAWMLGREQVTPDLVQALAADVLRHRIGLSYEAEASGLTADEVVRHIVTTVAVPPA